MRVVIIVLIVIVVAFAFVGVRGGLRDGGTAGDGAPKQNANGEVDEDALSDWRPPDLATLIADISAPFAPKLELPNPRITLAPGASESRTVPADPDSDMRVARIEMSSGVLRIEYACLPKSGRRCPQPVCICSPGSLIAPQQVSSCPQGSRRRLAGGMCTSDDGNRRASLIIYSEGGTLAFTALGTTNVTAQLK